jgi:hypothetical protein
MRLRIEVPTGKGGEAHGHGADYPPAVPRNELGLPTKVPNSRHSYVLLVKREKRARRYPRKD